MVNLENICMGCMTHQCNNGLCQNCSIIEADIWLAPHHLKPRTMLLGRYLIGRVIGEGGFGITYVGYDAQMMLKVAVKEYYPGGYVSRDCTQSNTVNSYGGVKEQFYENGRGQFLEEAKRLAKFFGLPGVVSVKDFFTENGTAYIVMEFVEGITLKKKLADMGGRMPEAQVLDIMKPLIKSLSQMHKTGIIHRDIAPDNIMVLPDGSVKLLDFGAARSDDDEGQGTIVITKHGYAPEEQYDPNRLRQGAWTDVYAICATIFRAIEGRTPPDAINRLREDNFTGFTIPVSENTNRVVRYGLAIRPEDRPQSLEILYAELYNPVLMVVPWYRNTYVLVSAIAIISLVLIALSVLLVGEISNHLTDKIESDQQVIAFDTIPPKPPLELALEPELESLRRESEITHYHDYPRMLDFGAFIGYEPSSVCDFYHGSRFFYILDEALEMELYVNYLELLVESGFIFTIVADDTIIGVHEDGTCFFIVPGPYRDFITEYTVYDILVYNSTDTIWYYLFIHGIGNWDEYPVPVYELMPSVPDFGEIFGISNKIHFGTVGDDGFPYVYRKEVNDIAWENLIKDMYILLLHEYGFTEYGEYDNILFFINEQNMVLSLETGFFDFIIDIHRGSLDELILAEAVVFAGETYMTSVTKLDLSEKNIKDISEISKFTELTGLCISYNDISDISALSGLIKLESLYIGNNKIINISMLSELTELENFCASNNGIKNISVLNNFKKMRRLSLNNNNISDLSPLEGLYRLNFLDLSYNNISDVSVLMELFPEVIFLDGNPLTLSQIDELRIALPYCEIYFGY